ncbi:MAG: hypothetical protein DI607_06755 [Sphingomonas hengshuiensis]|nr:MAG: hypothetical protein DI607_06755 [Sphingomonas hengshuiensis]
MAECWFVRIPAIIGVKRTLVHSFAEIALLDDWVPVCARGPGVWRAKLALSAVGAHTWPS